MKKGVDYTGVTVSFFCHDGQKNYVMHKRGDGCRDENGCWDFGGGSVKFNESLEEALRREVKEEYNADIKTFSFLGFDEKFRKHEGIPTHWIGFRYLVEVKRSQVVNNEPHMHHEIEWVRIDSLPEPRHSLCDKDLEKYKDQL